MITYDELAAALEDAWTVVGLHEHLLLESVVPETLERVYRAELFPAHPEPLTPQSAPPWVEVTFGWNAQHQAYVLGSTQQPGVLELGWTFTVDVRNNVDRGDVELVRAFHAAVQSALRKVAPDLAGSTEYIAVESRRGYRATLERPVAAAYVQLVGTNVTDLSDLWSEPAADTLRDALRDELLVVAAVLRALGETFTPGSIGSYRSVDTA